MSLEMNWKGNRATALGLVAAALLVAAVAGKSFTGMWKDDVLVPAPGFERHMLSEWHAPLAGTPADTPVYVQASSQPGGTVLVMGGTHPNEPAGTLAAVLLLEKARVAQGRLMVVPFGNHMAFTHNDPQEGAPQRIHLKLADGSTRAFKYGSRATNPIDQWPDPDVYIHPQSGQELSGKERSNLNRAHPGTKEGPLTLQLAYGLRELLVKEKVDLAFDLHEASPEYPVVNAIVAHEKSMELAAVVTMELEGQGIAMRLEPSPKNLRGLTHREWGDTTDTMPILMETANPSQGRLRGRTDEALVLTGRDKAYAKAMGLGRLFINYQGDQPLDLRVARHVTAIKVFLDNLGLLYPEKTILVEGIPDYASIVGQGTGTFLNPLGNAD